MASFDQWRSREPAERARRLTWLCGSEGILVEEIVSDIASYYSDAEYSSYDLSVQRESFVISGLSQYPLSREGKRLVVVREIECLDRWDSLHRWIVRSGRALPNNIAVFVSSNIDFPAKDSPAHDSFRSIQQRGSVIRCTNTSEQALANWVKAKITWRDVSCSTQTALHLVRRSNRDLAALRSAVVKASILGRGTALTVDVANQLLRPVPSDAFADNLIATDRPAAYASIEFVPRADYGRTIGLLFSRLELLGRLNRGLQAGKDMRNIVNDSSATGVPVSDFLGRRYFPHAKDYAESRRVRCHRLLTIVDDAYQRGATEGILESLVALW